MDRATAFQGRLTGMAPPDQFGRGRRSEMIPLGGRKAACLTRRAGWPGLDARRGAREGWPRERRPLRSIAIPKPGSGRWAGRGTAIAGVAVPAEAIGGSPLKGAELSRAGLRPIQARPVGTGAIEPRATGSEAPGPRPVGSGSAGSGRARHHAARGATGTVTAIATPTEGAALPRAIQAAGTAVPVCKRTIPTRTGARKAIARAAICAEAAASGALAIRTPATKTIPSQTIPSKAVAGGPVRGGTIAAVPWGRTVLLPAKPAGSGASPGRAAGGAGAGP